MVLLFSWRDSDDPMALEVKVESPLSDNISTIVQSISGLFWSQLQLPFTVDSFKKLGKFKGHLCQVQYFMQ